MTDLDRIREVLRETLQIDVRADQLTERSRLLGAIPEFDSVAVVNVIMALEKEYGVKIPDRELSADVFETMGSLIGFISRKTAVARASSAV